MTITNNYDEVKRQKININDIVAIYYNVQNNSLSYVCFTLGNKDSILKYLVSSNGKAISYAPNKNDKYWLLLGDNGSFLLFRQNDSSIPFEDIGNNEKDIMMAEYLMSM